MFGLTHNSGNRRARGMDLKRGLVKVLLAVVLVGGVALAGTGTAGASASRAAYNPYKEIGPAATCETYFDANWQPFHRMVAVSTPTMYSTRGRTYRVSWRPLLYKWNNGLRQWKLDQAGPTIFGIASLGTPLPSFNGFPAVAGNYYRVAIEFRWYRHGVAFRYPRARWVSSHAEIGYQYDANGGVHIGTKTVGEKWCYMN
jgi:hypothetical protein